MVSSPRLLAALTGAAALINLVHAKNDRVTIGAANVDRAAQNVAFELLPDAMSSTGLKARDGSMPPANDERWHGRFHRFGSAGETFSFATPDCRLIGYVVLRRPNIFLLQLPAY
jgi:hypothetical protein